MHQLYFWKQLENIEIGLSQVESHLNEQGESLLRHLGTQLNDDHSVPLRFRSSVGEAIMRLDERDVRGALAIVRNLLRPASESEGPTISASGEKAE